MTLHTQQTCLILPPVSRRGREPALSLRHHGCSALLPLPSPPSPAVAANVSGCLCPLPIRLRRPISLPCSLISVLRRSEAPRGSALFARSAAPPAFRSSTCGGTVHIVRLRIESHPVRKTSFTDTS